jgi:chaperonin GroES
MSTKTKTKVTPLSDRVLVQRIEETETTRGGIIIPDTAKEKPQMAKVVAVGAGKMKEDGTRVTPQVKSGNTILMSKYAGTDVKIDGDDFVILREDDILGIVE